MDVDSPVILRDQVEEPPRVDVDSPVTIPAGVSQSAQYLTKESTKFVSKESYKEASNTVRAFLKSESSCRELPQDSAAIFPSVSTTRHRVCVDPLGRTRITTFSYTPLGEVYSVTTVD